MGYCIRETNRAGPYPAITYAFFWELPEELIPAGVRIKKDSPELPGTVPAIRSGRADDLHGTDPLPLEI